MMSSFLRCGILQPEPPGLRPRAAVPLEPHKIGKFRYQPAVGKIPELVLHPTPLGEDDEEIAPGSMDEVQTEIGGEIAVQAVVLDEGVGGELRGEGISKTKRCDVGCEGAARHLDPVPLVSEFQRNLG